MDPTDFTLEKLNGMNYNDLFKLSIQHNLVKRRAKKQELIDKLLTLKNERNGNEEEGWRDASEVFKDLNADTNKDNRRLTYDVEEKDSDRRLTFEIPQDQSILFNKESRETYEVAPTTLVEPRATFEVPGKVIDSTQTNSRETFEVSDKKVADTECQVVLEKLDENEERRMTFVKERKIPSPKKINPEIKMLTIPISRISRRTTKKSHESPKKVDDPSLKMSKKSIAIKRPTRDIPKSPFNPRVKVVNIEAKRTPVVRSRTSLFTDKSAKKPEIKKPDAIKRPEESKETNKENASKILRRRKSKTEDNAVVKKPNPIKVSFLSPQISSRLRSSLPAKPTPGKNLLSSQNASKIPKPTRMPDFASIHKKQFEQMDSLHDWKKKKEDRARKLFGTPQPGPQNKSLQKPTVFQFQSSNVQVKPLESKFGKSVENLESKIIKKDVVKNKSAPRMQTDIKDRNRSHIHGVRTNKRFELQMRFRNL